MDIVKPIKSEPTSWILIDVQASSSDDNPFEVVDSFESQVIVDDDDKSDQQEDQDIDVASPIGPAIPSKVTRSEKLEKSVESIQQSLESLQSESRSNSTEIESIRARLDKLLLRPSTSSRSSSKLDIACNYCGMEIATQSEIVSRDFRGQSGPAVLIRRVSNVDCGPSMERVLMTGVHVTAWIFCNGCGKKLGWRYLDAVNSDQKYKIGMSCIEAEAVKQL